jgi:hypothetical protein
VLKEKERKAISQSTAILHALGLLLCVREMQIGIWEKFLARQTTLRWGIMAPRVKSERK